MPGKSSKKSVKTSAAAPVSSGGRPQVVDYREVGGNNSVVPPTVPPSSSADDDVDAVAALARMAENIQVGDEKVSRRFAKMEKAQQDMQTALGKILEALGTGQESRRGVRRSLSVGAAATGRFGKDEMVADRRKLFRAKPSEKSQLPQFKSGEAESSPERSEGPPEHSPSAGAAMDSSQASREFSSSSLALSPSAVGADGVKKKKKKKSTVKKTTTASQQEATGASPNASERSSTPSVPEKPVSPRTTRVPVAKKVEKEKRDAAKDDRVSPKKPKKPKAPVKSKDVPVPSVSETSNTFDAEALKQDIRNEVMAEVKASLALVQQDVVIDKDDKEKDAAPAVSLYEPSKSVAALLGNQDKGVLLAFCLQEPAARARRIKELQKHNKFTPKGLFSAVEPLEKDVLTMMNKVDAGASIQYNLLSKQVTALLTVLRSQLRLVQYYGDNLGFNKGQDDPDNSDANSVSASKNETDLLSKYRPGQDINKDVIESVELTKNAIAMLVIEMRKLVFFTLLPKREAEEALWNFSVEDIAESTFVRNKTGFDSKPLTKNAIFLDGELKDALALVRDIRTQEKVIPAAISDPSSLFKAMREVLTSEPWSVGSRISKDVALAKVPGKANSSRYVEGDDGWTKVTRGRSSSKFKNSSGFKQRSFSKSKGGYNKSQSRNRDRDRGSSRYGNRSNNHGQSKQHKGKRRDQDGYSSSDSGRSTKSKFNSERKADE